MNFIEWLVKKQQEEKKKQQQQQQQEAAAYDSIMSSGAGSEKYKAKKQVQQQNAQIKAQNDAIKKSNEKLQNDLAAEADKQGMNANEKMYYTQTQYAQKKNETKVPYKTMRDYRSNRIKYVDNDLDEIIKNDPDAQDKINRGNALNVYLNGGQTYDESIALGEGFKDTYMTQFRDDLSPEELRKLSYLLGDQEKTKTDHSQTIKDFTKTIEYRAGQAHEDKKYASGDYKKSNFYVNSAAQGAVGGTVGGFNKFIKRLSGDITPTVTLAEEKAYRKELSEAEGFKRIAGLTINSAAQMATSGGMGGMFASVAGNTYDQSRKQGYNDSEALTYALINAGMETVTTKLGGKLFGGYKGFVKGVPEIKNTISKVVKNPIAQRCAFLITDMGAEGVEETLQTAVDPLIRNTVFKENNNLVLSGKDYLESFLVGSLSVGALHAKSTAIGLSTDAKTINMDVKLPDGTYVGADTINRYLDGNATKSDVDTIKQLGSSINEENMNSVLKRMDDIANVKMGKDTYGEMNKKTAGMSAYDKISYFSNVMSSPEFKAHTEELVKTAQEQKAKAEGKKGVEGADGDTAIKENIKQEAVNSDNTEIKADKGAKHDSAVNNNVDINNQENINNNINTSDDNTQDNTISMNENVNENKSINDNADIKNDIEDKKNISSETITDKQDSFDNNEVLSNEGSQSVDTDNGFSSADKVDDNINTVSNINDNNSQLQSKNISNASELNETVSDNNTSVNGNKVNSLTTDTYNNIINPKAKRFSDRNIADKYMRPLIQEVWSKLTLQEKKSTYKYTQNSDPLNRPMRGFDKSWDNKVGIGNVSLNNEGAEQDIQNLTSAIDKSATKDDMWLYSSYDNQSLAELLGINKSYIKLTNVKILNEKFRGTSVFDAAFHSASISSDAGFDKAIAYEIYAPKGTKGIYVEPFSAYGHNEINEIEPSQYGDNWNGKYHSGGVHTEAEFILQKETEFEILEIKSDSGKIKVILKIIKEMENNR